MNHHLPAFLALALSLSVAGTALADPLVLGTKITISDANFSGTGWYGNHEDNETETNPDTIIGQQWDLEGMYLKGTTLALVGGFDFLNGAVAGGHTYRSGDIFVDVNGDAVYGPAAAGSGATSWGTPAPLLTTNLMGYDYALQLNFSAMTFNVYSLAQGTAVVSRVADVATSNPFRYISGGTAVAGYQNVAFQYFGPLSATNVGDSSLLGYGGNNSHYAILADTSFLPSGGTATFHFTQECGNDDLLGRVAGGAVPDSATTALLLAGSVFVLGAPALRRRLV